MKTLEQLAGAVALVVALADVFLTVLYARMDSGFLAMRYARGIERIWVWISGERVDRGRVVAAATRADSASPEGGSAPAESHGGGARRCGSRVDRRGARGKSHADVSFERSYRHHT